jgi:tetratricopeptide (TPR) repeat protein
MSDFPARAWSRCLPAALYALVLIGTTNGRTAVRERTSETAYQRALRSAAWVQVYENRQLRKMGTGFLVDRYRKLLITNQHVVDNHEAVEVVFPLYQSGGVIADKKDYIRYDRPIHGWVTAVDPKRDLAVIELEVVPHAATPMRLASDSLCPGEHVHLIGNPGTSELLWAHNEGTVHQVMRRKLEDSRNHRVLDALVVEIRTRTSVIPGYSGGPVVNDQGELAGIATMSNPAADWAWCVDITEVKDVLHMAARYPKSARRLLNPRSPEDFQDRQAYSKRYGQADHAIADFSRALRRDPTNALAYLHRGAAFARRGEWSKAIADFTLAAGLDPKNRLVYYNRALAYGQKGAYDQALADFTETLRLDPKNALAYFDRGLLYSRKAAHALAVADFDQALRLEELDTPPSHDRGAAQREMRTEKATAKNYAKLLLPDAAHAPAYNSLAWIWATSPDESRRDGKRAVAYATKGCELSDWKDANFLSTLAAASAECGQFKEAIAWQQKALALVQGDEAAKLRARLETYQAGRAYRDR